MKGTKKLNAKLISLFAIIVLLLGLIPMMALTAKPAGAAGDSVEYTAKWTGFTNLQLNVTPTQDGTVYYKLTNDSTSLTVDELTGDPDGTQACTANQTTSIDIRMMTPQSGLALYVVYIDSNGSYYGMQKLSLPSSYNLISSVDQTASVIKVDFKATRQNDSAIDLDITSTSDGKVYYVIQNDTDTPITDASEVFSSGTAVDCTADTTTTVSIETKSASAQNIYLVFEDSNGFRYTQMTTMLVPSMGYANYKAEIESYNPDFGTVVEGYTAPDALTLTINNTGSETLQFSLAEDSSCYDVVFDSDSAAIAAGQSGTFTIQPKTGLSRGTYDETIKVQAKSSDGSNVFVLSVPVKFKVFRAATGDYYSNPTDLYPVPVYNSSDNTIAAQPVYCIDFTRGMATDTHTDSVPYNKLTNVNADELANYAGLDTNSDGPATFWKDLNTERSAEDALTHIKWVLYNGYKVDAAGLQAKYGLTDEQFSRVTQAAIWHYTDCVYLDSSGHKVLGNYTYYFKALHYASVTQNMINCYNVLTAEDGTGLNTDVDGITLDIYVNAFTDPDYPDHGFQNLIAVNVPEDTDSTSSTSISITKSWENAGQAMDVTNFEDALNMGSWFELYVQIGDNDPVKVDIDQYNQENPDNKITGPTVAKVDGQTGQYTITYSNLPATYDGQDATYFVKEVIPSDYQSNIVNEITNAGQNGTGDYIGDGGAVTNKINISTTNISWTKKWEDNNNQDGGRPSAEDYKNYFVLRRGAYNDTNTIYTVDQSVMDAEGITCTVTDNNDGTYTITYNNLPTAVFDASTGQYYQYTYKLYEKQVEGYTVGYPSKEEDQYRGLFQNDQYKNDYIYGICGSDAQSGYSFINKHTPETVDVKVVKNWEGGVADNVTFTLTRKFADGTIDSGFAAQSITLDGSTDAVETTAWQGTFSGLDRYYNNSAHGQGEYQYVVAEQELAGYTSGQTSSFDEESGTWTYTFSNVEKTTTSADVSINVKKTLDGEAPGSNQFTFRLKGTSANAASTDLEVQNDGNGDAVFNLTYSAEGTYTYTLSEVPDTDNSNFNYDTAEYTVEVKVTKDADGVLQAEKTITKNGTAVDNAEFNNTTAAPAGVALKAAKTLDGRAPGEARFDFELTDNSGTVLQTKQNDSDGSITFDTLTFDKAGTYTYKIAEVKGEKGYIYDETVYTVTVNVTKDDDGSLKADVTYNNGTADVSAVSFANATETTTISGTKTWDDNDDQAGKRPESITVHVMKGSEVVATQVVKAGTDGSWTYTFDNLPKYENGKEIQYTIYEEAVPGYSTTYDGYDITNSYTTDTTYVEVFKNWDDSQNADGIRPSADDYASWLELYKGENADVKVDATPEVIDEGNDSYLITYNNLPKYENGEEIKYTVKEVIPDEYKDIYTLKTSDDNRTFTNTHVNEKTDVAVTKIWQDNNNAKGVRPDETTFKSWIRLEADGVDVTEQYADNLTVTANTDNASYKVEYKDLPKNKDGQAINYTIKEEIPEGQNYTAVKDSDGNHGTIVNALSSETIDIPVNKKWTDGASGESAVIELYANDQATGRALILNKDNSWTGEFTDLDKFDSDGNAVSYTVKEQTAGYDVEITGSASDGFTVTNRPSTETIDIPVKKVWADGASGESAVIVVKNGNNEVDRIELNENNNWQYTFKDLPKYNPDGTEISYTVDEVTNNYSYTVEKGSDGVYTITNSPLKSQGEVVTIPVKKVWADGASGENAVIVLTRDGTRTDTSIVLNEANNWEGQFKDLPKADDSGHVYEYGVDEITDTYDYTITGDSSSGYVITNSPKETATVDIPVQKEWADGASGENAVVVLTENGEQTDNAIVLDESNNWQGTFENLPKYDSSGNAITYGVDEITDTYDYTVTSDGNGGFIVTNSPSDTPVTPEEGSVTIPVQKVWADGASGEYAVVVLTENGVRTDTSIVLDESSNWQGQFTNLPETDSSGNAITYGVEEITDTYDYTVTSDGNGGFIVTNSSKTDTTVDIPVQKEWADGASGEYAVVVLTKNGEQTDNAIVLNESNNWQSSFENLPKYDSNGDAITYGVDEITDTYDYTITSDGNGGFIVTNSPKDTPVTPHDSETVNIPVQKVWADGASGDSAVIVLTQNGQTYQTIELNASNDWQGTFKDLPAYDADGNAYTYVVTEDTDDYSFTVASDGNGGYIITNSPLDTTVTSQDSETVDIPVQKVWADGASGDSAVIVLTQNGQTYQTIELNASNDWQGTFKDLPVYDADGNAYTYAVTEDTDDYSFTVASDGNGGYIVTNSPKDTTTTTDSSASSQTGSQTDSPQTGVTPDNYNAAYIILAIAGALTLIIIRRSRQNVE